MRRAAQQATRDGEEKVARGCQAAVNVNNNDAPPRKQRLSGTQRLRNSLP